MLNFVACLFYLVKSFPQEMVARVFLHGPGGSGKTYMLTRVILPVYDHFLPRASKGVAAQNSAARLITGATFHYMAALTRGQDLGLQKPTRAREGRFASSVALCGSSFSR